MAENQIQIRLAGQPERSQIRSFWKDVTEFYMLVLQRAFLPGLHGITVKYPCPSCAIRGGSIVSAAENSVPRSVNKTWTYLQNNSVPRMDSRRSTPSFMEAAVFSSWYKAKRIPALTNLNV